MSSINEVNDSTFQNLVLDSDKTTLVDFWAPWCMPCRMMTPILEQFLNKNGHRVNVVKLNTDENHLTASKYGIMSIPSLIFFKDGKEIGRTVGVQPADALEAVLDNVLQESV